VVFRAHHVLFERDEEQANADRQTESLAALAVLLALVLLGLFLFRALSAESAVEDCLLSGRRNCDAVAVAHPSPALW
jgi:hypothetical protein